MCVKPHLYRRLSLFSFMFACVCGRLCGGGGVCPTVTPPLRKAAGIFERQSDLLTNSGKHQHPELTTVHRKNRLAVERKCSSAGVYCWEMHTHVHDMDKSMWTTRCQSKITGCSILLSGKALHKTWKPGVVVNTDSKVVHPKRSWLGMLRSE